MGVGTGGVNDASQLHAGTLRHRLLAQVSLPNLPVNALDRRHFHSHADLAWTGFGDGHVNEAQYLGSAEALVPDGTHDVGPS